MKDRFRITGGRQAGTAVAPDDPVFGVWWRRTRVREDPWELLHREIDRSRRHRHQVTLVRLLSPWDSRGDRRTLVATLSALRRTLRSVDSVWADHDGIFVLMPESDQDAAQGLLARIGRTAPAIAIEDARVACFPQDAMTSNALRAAVGRELAGPPSLAVGPAAEATGDDDADDAPRRRPLRLRTGRTSS